MAHVGLPSKGSPETFVPPKNGESFSRLGRAPRLIASIVGRVSLVLMILLSIGLSKPYKEGSTSKAITKGRRGTCGSNEEAAAKVTEESTLIVKGRSPQRIKILSHAVRIGEKGEVRIRSTIEIFAIVFCANGIAGQEGMARRKVATPLRKSPTDVTITFRHDGLKGRRSQKDAGKGPQRCLIVVVKDEDD